MRSLLLSLCLWLALAASARAQSPELLSAYPAGGRRGTTVALTLRGHHLQNVTAVLVSGKGVRAAFAPGNQDERNLPLRLTIAPDAPLGPYELRVATARGGSNPTQIWVDTLPESLTVEPNDDIAHAQPLDTLPVLINGWLSAPTARDTFAFHANAGETFVFDLNCWRHRSQMDGVLELYDARGALLRLATAPWESDPRLIYTFDRAGRYFLTVHDTQFLGGPQHTYRLSVGRLPVLTAYQPRAGRPGETLTLSMQGVNLNPSPPVPLSHAAGEGRGRGSLPLRRGGLGWGLFPPPVLGGRGRGWGAIKLSLPADAVPGEVCWIAPETPNGLALPIALWMENLPVASGQAGGQVLTPPIAVNGAIAKPGAAPTFRFRAQAGQTLRFDVLAQQLGAAMDSNLRILDASGKELAANDDGGTLLAGAAAGIGKDSRLEWKAPANGAYRAEVTNLTGQGGPDCFFRLEIVPIVPDFRVLLNAAKTDVAQGGATILTAAAERTGGFEGEIHLRAEGLPPGVTCREGVIPAGKLS
ncbi:MAG TPA: hypothetical protein VFB21_04385, partial [Chthonomonadaceae bacterium]|nr:hypothetical protein [Chthonomonadaceae bacterium]